MNEIVLPAVFISVREDDKLFSLTDHDFNADFIIR